MLCPDGLIHRDGQSGGRRRDPFQSDHGNGARVGLHGDPFLSRIRRGHSQQESHTQTGYFQSNRITPFLRRSANKATGIGSHETQDIRLERIAIVLFHLLPCFFKTKLTTHLEEPKQIKGHFAGQTNEFTFCVIEVQTCARLTTQVDGIDRDIQRLIATGLTDLHIKRTNVRLQAFHTGKRSPGA